MLLHKITDSPKSSSRGLIIAIAIIVFLALGYTVFRTVAVPKHDFNQATPQTK